MEKENISIKMEIDMKDIGEMEKKKEKVYIIGKKEINLKDFLKIIKEEIMVKSPIKMEKYMKVN